MQKPEKSGNRDRYNTCYLSDGQAALYSIRPMSILPDKNPVPVHWERALTTGNESSSIRHAVRVELERYNKTAACLSNWKL